MNNLARNIIIWLIFGAALIGLFNLFQGSSSGQNVNNVAYSDFIAKGESRQIDEVLIDGRDLRGKSSSGQIVTSIMPEGPDVVKVLDDNDVRIVATPEDDGMPSFFSILLSWFPMLLFIGIWIFSAANARRFSWRHGFWKVPRKITDRTSGRVTEDVAGIDEAKSEPRGRGISQRPGKVSALGGKIPKGVLLVGPPGTGKTLLARQLQ